MSEALQMDYINDTTSGSDSTHNQPEKKYGIFRAKCVNSQDPEKTGRIKVWIPALNYTKAEEEEGTWAYPCCPFAGPNLEKNGDKVSDFGSLYLPPKDSYVYVFFEDGDTSKPIYFGGVVTEGAIPTENQAGKQWWNKHTVIKSPEKRMIFMSDDSQSDSSVIIRGKDRNAN